MYIISKHKDYYDGVVGSVGMDKTLVYERKTTDATNVLKEFSYSHTHPWKRDRENPFLNIGYADVERDNPKKYESRDFFIVGFCGKLYLGWKLHYKVEERGLMGIMEDVTKTDIVYGYENVKDFIKNNYWHGKLEDDIKFVQDYNPIEMFRKLKTPVFVHDTDAEVKRGDFGIIKSSTKLIVNPVLKDYEFYKVVDAFTAFTELQMFIGGVLGVGEKEIIEVEDKYKIGQHGFDKWSFRREPSKKRR